MAGGGRGPGLRVPVPRLERADHGRVLRAQRRVAHPRRRGADRADRQQLRPDQLQLRPDAAGLAGGSSGPRSTARSWRRTRQSRERFSRARLGAGAGLQPHRSCRSRTGATSGRRSSGGSPTSSAASAASRKGMWLPETAVDLRDAWTCWRRQGIRFTILAPHQARACDRWAKTRVADVERRPDRSVDPLRGELPSGRTDRPLLLRRRDLAGGGLRGAARPRRALRRPADVDACRDEPGPARLVHIATDGETYGHHHRHGEMALSYALHHIEANGLARLTNYGEFLAAHPPEHEVEIVENTLLELRPRRRALARATAAATPAASRAGTKRGGRRCARRSTGCATSSRRVSRAAARELLRRSLGGAGRLHRRGARPLAGERGRFLRSARRAATGRGASACGR